MYDIIFYVIQIILNVLSYLTSRLYAYQTIIYMGISILLVHKCVNDADAAQSTTYIELFPNFVSIFICFWQRSREIERIFAYTVS